MIGKLKLAAFVLATMLMPALAFAQSPTKLCGPTPNGGCQVVTMATASVPVSTSSAATGQLVAAVSGQKIAVQAFSLDAGGSTTAKFVYGTGTNCGTGTTDLTGSYTLTSGAPVHIGAGIAPILFVPAGNALCLVNSASVALAGFVSYAQYP